MFLYVVNVFITFWGLMATDSAKENKPLFFKIFCCSKNYALTCLFCDIAGSFTFLSCLAQHLLEKCMPANCLEKRSR